MANGDWFSWIGDGVRSAGTFLFGENGINLDLKDVFDAGSAAFGGGSAGAKGRMAANSEMSRALMSKAAGDTNFSGAAMKKSAKSDAPLVDQNRPIFKDQGGGDPWMMSFRRLVEGTKNI